MKLKIDHESSERVERGAALQYSPTGEGPWSSIRYGETIGHCLAKFNGLPSFCDTNPDHYRVSCHHLDLGNARFWSYVNGGWVKITLRPGQKLHWACGGPNDEGVNVAYECWHFDDYDGCLYSSVANYGYDCDGRYSSESEFRSSVVDLRFHEIDCDLGPADRDDKGQPIRTPNWDRVRASQRDYAAEAMGY